MGLSILDVINSGKWKRALFTSYVLSLSFFESVLLRSLRQMGCQEIWVITDTQGYRDSLIERRSLGVGQEFRLVPVSLKEGVFHPKCTYLEGEQSDVLIVGSGNLTFGGFGRNIELIEVLLSTTAPSVFRDFAGFLTSIENRSGKDLRCPDVAWINVFRDCASRWSQLSQQPPQEQVRLIHTVDLPVLDQLPAQIRHLKPREMIVMSPFFDNDASAVRKLADALGCTSVKIAVRPNEHKSNFPFKEARKWKQSIAAVWPDTIPLKRPLHAKWIETRGEMGTAVLTGSINATMAASCTTRNIEVGVLRTSSNDKEWTRWDTSTIPKHFEPAKYEFGSVDELLVYAYLAGDGDLSGTILGAQIPSGLWKASLIKPSGETKRFELQVRSDGRFRATLPQAAEFSLRSGSQLSVRHGSTIARGWVHVEDILRMPRLPRLNIPAMLRLVSREDTEEDEIALLEYLAVNATKVIEHTAPPNILFQHNKMILQTPPGTSGEMKRDIVARWYRNEIKAAAPELIAKWEPLIGVKVERVFVQKMKTKWGSCNPRARSIRLNTDLAKKPRECLEYIIVHEMVHLIERHHNDRFRKYMDQFLPPWHRFQGELNSAPLAHEKWSY